MDVIAALAFALGAFDAEHVELALDVAEDQIGSGHLTMLSRFLLRGGQLLHGARAREAPAPLTVPPSTRRETSRRAETRAGLLEWFPPFPKYFFIQVSPNDLSVATRCVYATAIVAAPRVFDPVPWSVDTRV